MASGAKLVSDLVGDSRNQHRLLPVDPTGLARISPGTNSALCYDGPFRCSPKDQESIMGASASTGTVLAAGLTRSPWAVVSALAELLKGRVTAMVLVTTAAGYYLALDVGAGLALALHTLTGTGLLAAGTAALNQFMERHQDGLMRRTRLRPLPAGRLAPWEARVCGMFLVASGTLYLLVMVNPLTALLGWLTSAVYLLVYTPLKTRTAVCTLVGAVPGAVPPMMGWTAVRNGLGPEPLILFGILFAWQFPHFLAIARLYREDYERAGFRMLPRQDSRGQFSGLLILVFAALLYVVSLLPWLISMAGQLYLIGAVIAGLIFGGYAWRSAFAATRIADRKLLRVSVFYLPALLALLVVDKL